MTTRQPNLGQVHVPRLGNPRQSSFAMSDFRELKETTKQFRNEAKAANEKLQAIHAALKNAGFELPDDSALQAIPQQIQTLRQQAATASPEVTRELESYRTADRHYALTRSHTYRNDHLYPMNKRCRGL